LWFAHRLDEVFPSFTDAFNPGTITVSLLKSVELPTEHDRLAFCKPTGQFNGRS